MEMSCLEATQKFVMGQKWEWDFGLGFWAGILGWDFGLAAGWPPGRFLRKN